MLTETILDLGTVQVTLSIPRSAESLAREEEHNLEMEASRLAYRALIRAGLAAGVVEKPCRIYQGRFELEAFGTSPEAVAQAIDVYLRRGPNSSRFNITFFAVKPDVDGGFVARGHASKENF